MTTRKIIFVLVALGLLLGCFGQGSAFRSPHTALVYSRQYDINLMGLEEKYGFDIRKYAKIHDRLIQEGVATESDFLAPEPVSDEQLLLVHTRDYLKQSEDPKSLAVFLQYSAIELLSVDMLCSKILQPIRYACGGTLLACRVALQRSIAINLAGGYHHAHSDRGSGFCIYADVAVAIRAMQKTGQVERVLIVDLDLHQGNGNATIFQGDDAVFTFSVHEENIFPIPKARSDLDIGLDAGVDDEHYMNIVRSTLPEVIDRARPDLIVYVAGTDLYYEDPLGHLKITAEGIVRRDLYVVDAAVRRGIPIAMVLAGGYTKASWRLHYDSIKRIIERYPLPCY